MRYGPPKGGFLSRREISRIGDAANAAGHLIQEARWDDTDEHLIVKTTQDVEPITRFCKELQVHGRPGGDTELGRHVALIPNGIVHKWMREGFNVYTVPTSELLKKLNDSEWSQFRTIGGKL